MAVNTDDHSAIAAAYRNIQDWVRRQQEKEAINSAPAPITDAQKRALLELEFLINVAPPQPEPVVGAQNWVGLLQEYQAAREHSPAGITGVSFTEAEAVVDLNAKGVLRWRHHVTIKEFGGTFFPGSEGGLLPDGSEPSFARKKDAKQYAAKCAVEWLRDNGRMPRQGGIKFPKLNQQIQAQQKPKPSPTNSTSNSSSSTQAEPRVVSPFDDTEVSKTHEVQQLCQKLGFHLQYQLVQDATGSWGGYPELGIHAFGIPNGVPKVEGIIGKKEAKEKIAEELLERLRKLYAVREEERKRIMGEARSFTDTAMEV